MAVDVEIAGLSYRLRPVTTMDAEFILKLRQDDPARTKYLHPIRGGVEEQVQWIEKQRAQPDDYYWVVESVVDGQAEGLIGLYDYDSSERSSVWGRWIIRKGSMAALESVFLLYQIAFERIQLRSVYSLTISENASVVSFHDSCGLVREGRLTNYYQLNGINYDVIKHCCDRILWSKIKPNLEALVCRMGSRAKRGLK